MAEITLLDQETVDKIAAGEVVERPSSVVKELIENSMDAGASAITVEIKEGGISLIRITDNGCGMEKEQVPKAFLRHSTSKIRSAQDLLTVSSMGFRGEALSSIAAVSQIELITKTASDLTGLRYLIEGSRQKEAQEVGAPDGTTFVVRNLFYNTPARRKFLKTPQTEGSYIVSLVECLALSRPDISFKLIVNNQIKLHTSGNSNVKDVIFQIYGRQITSSLVEVSEENDLFTLRGYIGKPMISRGNRNFEHYFVNTRYIRSSLITKSLEDAYKGFLMQRQYPFCVLYFIFDKNLVDVNVHPSKMELRFDRKEEIYEKLHGCIRPRLLKKDPIRTVSLGDEQNKEAPPALSGGNIPEPFEKHRMEQLKASVRKDSPYEPKYEDRKQQTSGAPMAQEAQKAGRRSEEYVPRAENRDSADAWQGQADLAKEFKMQKALPQPEYVQEEIRYEGAFLSEQAKKRHKIIGQLFDTYWLVEYQEKLFIIDQHAAHEKVLYEKTLRSLKNHEFTTQYLSPPLILTLNSKEQQALSMFEGYLGDLGFEIEPFGGREYAICGVPGNLFGIDAKQALLEILDAQQEIKKASTPLLALEKIASMSCKAAVKGNHTLKRQEAIALIDELLELENPYFCPHGRPTIISMEKQEIEKKFKRIV